MTTTSTVLLPPGGQRILVIMAHPDDAEFICGGTIARLAADGCDISYVLVTSGNRGSHEADMTMERLAKIREEEQRHAADMLGVREVTFLGHNDGEVEVTLALRGELVHAIRRAQPDVLFTFDPWRPYEIHPDHRNVGLCALDALASADTRPSSTESPVTASQPWRFGRYQVLEEISRGGAGVVFRARDEALGAGGLRR